MQEERRNPATAILVRPFQQFFRLEAASGILLLISAVVALLWANSRLAASYFELWDTGVAVSAGSFALSKSLLHWINDGLMAVFFLLAGLEIKRELLVGELAEPKKAALSVAAAAGGMIVPAGIYGLLNAGGIGAAGWGIPMATDIAFALGVLALLGRRVSPVLAVFVTAVAIVDDLGAVVVIAVFYTAEVSLAALGAAGAFLAALMLLNGLGARRIWPYLVLGLGLWVCLLKSGMHATIAGVLLALTIPARRLIDAPEFVSRAELLLSKIRGDVQAGQREPSEDQQDAIHSLDLACKEVETPLQRLEHALHPWVAFFVVPVFALANAGVKLGGEAGATLSSPVTLGIILGLLLGKPLGILVFAWLAARSGVAALPGGVTWRQMSGVSLLCGIGFTMSLFIASLAFGDSALLDRAKVGILAGSLISGFLGALVLALRPSAPPGHARASRPAD